MTLSPSIIKIPFFKEFNDAGGASFPDWYEFVGNETQRFNQIGNAVPPILAYQMALALKVCFQMDELYSVQEIIENNLQPNQVLTLF